MASGGGRKGGSAQGWWSERGVPRWLALPLSRLQALEYREQPSSPTSSGNNSNQGNQPPFFLSVSWIMQVEHPEMPPRRL